MLGNEAVQGKRVASAFTSSPLKLLSFLPLFPQLIGFEKIL